MSAIKQLQLPVKRRCVLRLPARENHIAATMAPARVSASRLSLSRVMHILVIVTSLSIAFTVFDGTLFAWHPLFLSIGYLLFMAEGLMSALGFRMLDGPDRMAGIQGHVLLQIRAMLAIALGFGVIYKNKVTISCLCMLQPRSHSWPLNHLLIMAVEHGEATFQDAPRQGETGYCMFAETTGCDVHDSRTLYTILPIPRH